MIDIGHTIGNYKITAKLGEGGMGVVYLAEHPVIGKKVAMKAIHPELSKNSDVVSRFVTEAKAVNQIGHEHIVDIADFGNTPEGEFYFVMEYLQGESLSERLRRETRIDVERALSISAQIADALDASHEHGDHPPRSQAREHLPRATRGRDRDFVKVLDFGLAKLTPGEQKVTHKTRTGSVMGTPYYMSPEQCEGKIEIDHRADIYSLGVMLFEMLTGKVPFGGEGYGEIIVKHVTMPPPSARSVVPELPDYLDLDPVPRAGEGPRPALPDHGGAARGAAATRALHQHRRPRSASPTTVRASRAPRRRWRGPRWTCGRRWVSARGWTGRSRRAGHPRPSARGAAS